ncbi:substrate-binding periplasmic protein [Rhodoferax aquaticus]|uniref:Transporter substrate-binding domain-containing protein n=1 Tax=Rhodoferax aquaticus TaxID=2527691 RepID=A0A515EMS6_9BURK|nr:transporter substrate-binding domain-containing protein [Rhodoferax aquaticus]QDL53963.1 transporter substrate-binding domain-containing protein [Rhodoferax aquaticus]
MKRRVLIGAGSLLGAAVLLPTQAQTVVKVRMAYFEDFAPMSFKTPKGDMAGIFIETLNHIAKASGVAFQHSGFPWQRAQNYIKAGELDALCAWNSVERKEYLWFASTPVIEQTMGIYHRPKDARVQAIRSVQDMRALAQGSYLGNGYAKQYLEPDLIKWQADMTSVLRLVAAESLDIFVEGELIGKAAIEKHGLQGKLAFTPLPFLDPVRSYFGLRKSFDKAQHIVERVDGALGQARKSGALGIIYKKYV